MKGLSRRQKEILEYIKKKQDENNVQPTVKEISLVLKISYAYVSYMIRMAELKGYCKRKGNRYIEIYNLDK